VLKLGALIAAGGALAPLLAACAAPSGSEGAPVASAAGGTSAASPASTTLALSGPITVLTGGGDPSSEPALKKVYDDFRAQHPAIEWDIRVLPGLGPEWDRLARATLESGEPVGLVTLDGLFVRAWTRDGLLPGWPRCSPECHSVSISEVSGRQRRGVFPSP
jgi:ABC-type glycerol-3-phosphate transport system substrate-binding protein